MWIAGLGSEFFGQGGIGTADWGNIVILTGLTASMTVNALVTTLIVFRIFKVFREVKSVTTPEEISLGITGGRKLRSIMFIIIESGMALFAVQLTRVVLVAPGYSTDTEKVIDAYGIIVAIHEILNVIICSIVFSTLYQVTDDGELGTRA
jgi:hypothetical protein